MFWLKIISCSQVGIYAIWLRYGLLKDRDPGMLEISGDIFSRTTLFFMIFIYAAIDGMIGYRRSKIAFGICLSGMLTISAIIAMLVHDNTIQATTIYIMSSNINISIQSLYAGSLRVLAIFLWKQTFILIL